MPPLRGPDGKFLPRDDSDMSIAEVMQQSDQAKADQRQADTEREQQAQPQDKKPAAKPSSELSAETGSFLGNFVDGKEKKAAEPTEAEKAAEAERLKKETADKEKAAAAKKKPKPAAQPEPLTAAQIAAAAAEGVARVINKPAEVKKPEQKDAGASTYTPSDERKIAVLGQMEKMYPDKYKDAPKRYKDALAKIEAYSKEWTKLNPSKEFNEDDDEHAEFFEKNQLHEFWEPEDFDEAKTEMRVQKALEEERRANNKRLDDHERKFKLQDPETVKAIDVEQVGAAKQYWKLFGEELGILKDDGTVDEEKAKKSREADPFAFDLRLNAAQRLDHEVAELYKLMNALIEPSPKSGLHKMLGDFAATAEQRLAAKPLEDRQDGDGRDFLPAEKYYALEKEEREAKYWTFTARDLAALRADVLARETQALIKKEEEKLDKYAKARGLVPKDGAAASRKEPKEEGEEVVDEDPDKPLSPEGGSETKLSAGKGANGKGSPASANSFFGTNW